jgi:hypothetical protein
MATYELVRVFFRFGPGYVAVRNPNDTKMSVWLLHHQAWTHPDAFKREEFKFLGKATQRDLEREGVNLATAPTGF